MSGASSSMSRAAGEAEEQYRARLLQRARQELGAGHRETAIALYRRLIEANPKDDEVRVALARVLAWQGRLEEAERLYRQVLALHPDDVEVQGGLVNVLLWQRRFPEAEALLDRERARQATAQRRKEPVEPPELLVPRARLQFWKGDETAASATIHRAVRLYPDDVAAAHAYERIHVGELRLILYYQRFPRGNDDLPGAELLARQSWRRFTFSLRTEQSRRYPSISDYHGYNALYAAGLSYRFGYGWSAAAELGVGYPSPTIPRWLARVTGTAPLGGLFSATLAYSFWSYSVDAKQVHILSPELAMTPVERLRLFVRYWFVYVYLPWLPPMSGLGIRDALGEAVHGVGVGGTYQLHRRFSLGAAYTYGAQLDQPPGPRQLTPLRSHIVTGFGDWLVRRRLGLRPLYQFELRKNLISGVTMPIHTFELGIYTRW